jgi:DNA primase
VSYLKGRGITGSIAAKFVIGFSTSDWQGLREVFTDYDESELLGQVGLIKDNDGRRYDRFRGRLMFPIRDHRGRVIAFGGRIIGEGEPKYLNSPETDLFHKGKEVYGLWESRSGIRNSKRVLVVEGYMDVVGLHQHGIDYAVATLGTATTEFQVSRLLKYAAEIIFCFDGDKAGKKAAFRALENTLGQVSDAQKISFMFLPDGEDPDSFVRRYSKQEFEKKIVEALPMSEFLLSELSDQAGGVQTIEGKSKLAHLASAHLPAIKKAPVMRTLLRNRLVEMTGLEQGDFGEKNFENGKLARETYSRRIGTPQNRSNRTPSVIKHIVEILIIYPSLATERDVDYLHSYRANLGKHVTEREVDFLHYVLTHCLNEVDRTVALGKMRDADFKDDIDKREKLASLRYLVNATSLDNAKEEYTNAWAQLERWNRNAIADRVLKSKDLSTLSLEDREILQGLSKK